MNWYRVFYIRKGTKLTKLVRAFSALEAREMFKNCTILMVAKIDLPDFDS